MEALAATISPRRQSQVASALPFVVFVVAIPLLPFGWAMAAVLVAGLAGGTFRLVQQCPLCGVSIARERRAGLLVYTPVAPRTCENGHALDRPVDPRRPG